MATNSATEEHLPGPRDYPGRPTRSRQAPHRLLETTCGGPCSDQRSKPNRARKRGRSSKLTRDLDYEPTTYGSYQNDRDFEPDKIWQNLPMHDQLTIQSENDGDQRRREPRGVSVRCPLCSKEKAEGYELRRHLCATHQCGTTAKPDGFTRRLGVTEESLIRLEGKEYSDYHHALFGRPLARRHHFDGEHRHLMREQQAHK